MLFYYSLFCFFFFNDTATTEIYTLSLHDALPIPTCAGASGARACDGPPPTAGRAWRRRSVANTRRSSPTRHCTSRPRAAGTDAPPSWAAPTVESATIHGQALSNNAGPPRGSAIPEFFSEPTLGISGSMARCLLWFGAGGPAEPMRVLVVEDDPLL